MPNLTANNLVREINSLDTDRYYQYIDPSNPGLIKIIRVNLPEGPIIIKRWNPHEGKSEVSANSASISKEMLWRLANSLVPMQPINVDRVFGGSYNTRSVLEALLAHTPNFHFCYPNRIETIAGVPRVKQGHKHLMWTPEVIHDAGITVELETNVVISEVPSVEAYYDVLTINEHTGIADISGIDAEVRRTHALMQIALYTIGRHLGYRTYIAQNDRGIVYQNKSIVEHEGIIVSLGTEQIMQAYPEAVHAARLIDCVWFKNGRLMPAVIEVEHSTGVTSGLDRMKTFKEIFPPIRTRYVIVAPDEDRGRVVQEANKPQYRDLDTRYFCYSAVNEFYSLLQRRRIRGITDEFLDSFMEPVVQN
jgi:hypothetical protein